MKNYFPFTDYDFYAYLASGGLFLAIIDFTLNDSTYLNMREWGFAQITIAIVAAYILGHLIAMLAQTVLETFIMSRCLEKPMTLQLGTVAPNWFERILGSLVGRYYEPLPLRTRTKILECAASELGVTVAEVNDAEDVFQIAFRKSFSVDGVRQRIDEFRNQYGFCRNIAFVALIATGLLTWKAWCTGDALYWQLTLVSAVVFVGMFVRFVKFLGSFQAEIIRTIK
ncbi:hypothetical protein [Kordiimonas pumila]|uniref:Uncharacterized protein n=1 Tax=Kordiimonas pumila TaxID=2161677 RepID=A0ABV7D383_9PROT|nr:hypothetical protein [Kordiimonas pumila]